MIRLDVPQMTSEQCQATVMGALMGVDPAAQCNVDLARKRVALDTKLPPSDFIEALEEVGYSSFLAQV